MTSATIKLFLPSGDATRLRTAEISNWTGKALAAPRTDLEALLSREELDKAGVYLLTGNDPETNAPRVYIGEAEVVRDRLRQQRSKEFWVSAIVFVSKDEHITKAHVRYLESRLLEEAQRVGRLVIDQNQASGSKLPESDRADMEVFLAGIRKLLPVLGSQLLEPIAPFREPGSETGVLSCGVKDAEARGQRSPDGFVVFKDSTAVLQPRPSAPPWLHALREQLREEGTLVADGELLRFTKDRQFPSPSAAAAAVLGGSANGLKQWKTSDGTTLKVLDESS